MNNAKQYKNKGEKKRYHINEIIRKNSTHSLTGQRLKQKLKQHGMIEDECYTCGIIEWNGIPLTLHLVHVDEDVHNNQLTNIIIQCPNCFSQKYSSPIFINTCIRCGNNTPMKKRLCICCRNNIQTKINKKTLKEELVQNGFSGVMKKYNITKQEIISKMNT
tara:strand:- start:829 stop:1314 length:486 start_codon:yes stop_codon:yes gene_type:complete